MFGLGLKKEYKGTEYGIGLFPLGGYVKVAGVIDESMDSEFTGAPDEFRSKNTLEKIWIMSAGVIMNFLLAILIFSHLTYHNGINDADSRAIVGQVLQEYPAESLGLQAGDEIISINDVQISDWEEDAEKGTDRVGEYRDWDVEYDPLEHNPDNDPEIRARNDKRKQIKSYIDMPNIKAFTFLDPVKITFGFTLAF